MWLGTGILFTCSHVRMPTRQQPTGSPFHTRSPYLRLWTGSLEGSSSLSDSLSFRLHQTVLEQPISLQGWMWLRTSRPEQSSAKAITRLFKAKALEALAEPTSWGMRGLGGPEVAENAAAGQQLEYDARWISCLRDAGSCSRRR